MRTIGVPAPVRKVVAVFSVMLLLAGTAVALGPFPAAAHCDSVNGPVVAAARAALEAGDVKLVLPYVAPASEAELSAAFEEALAVHRMGGTAQQLADRYFFETAVRLHRAGEGASYTGLKFEAVHDPALEAAENALMTGSLDEVEAILLEAVRHGVHTRFEAVHAARQEVENLGTVAADRERVEAELIFEKYVVDLYHAALSATARGDAGEAGAAPVHSH